MRIALACLVLLACDGESVGPDAMPVDIHAVVECGAGYSPEPSGCETACAAHRLPDQDVRECQTIFPGRTEAGPCLLATTFDGVDGCCFRETDTDVIMFSECID